MAQKRTRRANGEKDAKGKAKRRKNLTGTLEKRGDKWLARYYIYIDGERRRKTKTLEAVTVEEAREELSKLSEGGAAFTQERELEKTERELRGIRADIEAEAQRKAKEEARRRADEDEARAITIADAWTHYEASKKRPDSGARTIAGYRAQYTIFAAWTAKHYPDRPKMRDFAPNMAEAFLDHLEKIRSRNTRNKYLIFLRTFWRVLRWNPDAQLTIDPWDGIRTLTQTPDEVTRRELTTDELGRIGQAIMSEEIKQALRVTLNPTNGRGSVKVVDLRGELAALFAVGIYTGLRLGDCATLDWSMIDTGRGIITATPRKTARKYARQVIIPLHPCLAAILAAIPPEARRGFVMPTLADIYLNREPSMLTNRIQAIFGAAGIQTTADAPRDGGGDKARTVVGFHSLRHFFAAWLDNHGVNHSLTNYLTCHQQGTVEARYFHENREALAAAVGTLPAISSIAASAGATQTAEPIAIANAAEDAPAAETIDIPADNTDAAEGRFRAFCDALDGMGAAELKRAAAEIARRLGDMV